MISMMFLKRLEAPKTFFKVRPYPAVTEDFPD
jgi:hypothetical protein